MKTPLHSIIAVSLLSSLPLTAQVDQSKIIPFQAGTPATAADMNQTIQALVTAINDNAAKLSPNLVGSSWKIVIQTIGLGIDKETVSTPLPEGGSTSATTLRAGHVIEYQELTIALNSDGSYSGTISGYERSVNIIDNDNSVPVLGQSQQIDTRVSEGVSGTWSLNGSTLTVTIPDPIYGDDILNFTLSASADMLVSISAYDDTYEGPLMKLNRMMIGVRTTTAP